MKKNIALIDFGAGNLHSVYKAFKYIGANIEITRDKNAIDSSSAVVFPGVGAFGSVMNSIRKKNLEDIITKQANSTKPFLGICVGMQVLFEGGEENPDSKGLSIFKGSVVKFKKAKKIPHIGWNSVFQSHKPQATSHKLKYYFVHSYYCVPEDKEIIYGETEYEDEKFTSIIKKENIFAVQFHPEKSGEAGLELLKQFLENI